MRIYQRVCFSILTLLSCSAAVPASGQTTLKPSIASEQFSFVDGIVQQQIRDGKLVGAVTWISLDGKVVHHVAHGMRDRVQSIRMQPDCIFRIHSFTKAITTAAALMLWEEGKYDLDDPVAKYLPAFAIQTIDGVDTNRQPGRPMTVRDLMTHTSGVIYPNQWGSDLEKQWHNAFLRDKNMSLGEFSDKIANLPLAFAPGERWRYGMSIDVLGHLIEVWSGQKFDDFLRQRIFTPLSMNDTDFFVPREKLRRLATLYVRDKQAALQSEYGKDRDSRHYVPTRPPKFCSGGGGLFSTARDYGTFLHMILAGGDHDGNQVMKPDTIALMTTDQLPKHIAGIQFGNEVRDGFKFGLGFNVITKRGKWDPHARVSEYGWGGAASCHYWIWPPKRLAVITLEATWPYNRNLEDALKERIYSAVDLKVASN